MNNKWDRKLYTKNWLKKVKKLRRDLTNAINEVAKKEARRANDKPLPFRPFGEWNPEKGHGLIFALHHFQSLKSRPKQAKYINK